MVKLLFPLQIGVALPLGTEVGFKTAEQWFRRNRQNTNSVFVKLDFANAFNTVSRQAVLREVREHFPGLARWTEWCYCGQTNLVFGAHDVRSISATVGISVTVIRHPPTCA